MKLRHVLPVLPASFALVLTLAACTPSTEPQAQSTDEVELALASDADPTYQALAAVYAAQLEDAGFQVTLLEPGDDPVAQLQQGQARVAVTAAGQFLARQQEALEAAQATGSSTTETSVLSREDISKLATAETSATTDNASAAAESEQPPQVVLSPGDLGQVLVMSRASMALHKVNDFADIAAACPDLRFATDAAAADQLLTALTEADCSDPTLNEVQDDVLAGTLRYAEADVVALSQAKAMIADEGFVQVPDSAQFFDSQPVLAFGAADLDGRVQAVLDEVTAQLDEQTLQAVNRMIEGPDAASAQQVAEDWEWLRQ